MLRESGVVRTVAAPWRSIEGIAHSFHRHLKEVKPGCRSAVALITTLVNLTVSQKNLRRQRQEERQPGHSAI